MRVCRPGTAAILPVLIHVAAVGLAHDPHTCPAGFPDQPTVSAHVEQEDILSGFLSFEEVVELGRQRFAAKWNICDGQGRPAATGTGDKRIPDQPDFIRTSSPEANSCAGCHVNPRMAGAGEFVSNAFVLAQALDPVTVSVSALFSNERNPPGLFGAGAIEMLAREMSEDLILQLTGLQDGHHILTTKGIDFEITIEGGSIVASRGVDPDLVIKPFHQAGVVVSLREFVVNAFNHHHGMQAEERFDLNRAKGFDPDFDEDGVTRELTIGDITATTIFLAQLGIPGRVLPSNNEERELVQRGETLFEAAIANGGAGCAGCHRPELPLRSRLFVEPNPFNPQGTFNDAFESYAFDLTQEGERPRLEASGAGAVVRAFTDLKRHNLCDPPGTPDAIRFFCNEQLSQGRPDQDGRPGSEFFLTKDLWDVGNSEPYGHRGDLTTISEAILVHAGEARDSRDAFVAMSGKDQRAIVSFLKCLRVLPAGSAKTLFSPAGKRPSEKSAGFP